MNRLHTIFVHGGDQGLEKAVAALRSAGLDADAAAWASDPVPKPRPQVLVPRADLERAWQVLRDNGVEHVPIF